MSLKFTSLSRYKSDINRFKKSVNLITNLEKKQKLLSLISKLEFHAKQIDNAHSTSNTGAIDPRVSNDNISEIRNIRVEIEKLLKTLDNA
jgi:hypothetical protein